MSAAPHLPHDRHADSELVPAPVTTLAEALAWFGHVCRDGCAETASSALGDIPVAAWFVRRGAHRRASLAGRIVVDLTASRDSAARTRALLKYVRDCAEKDGIEIRWRRDGSRKTPSGRLLRQT
jgi:hypothetical protein